MRVKVKTKAVFYLITKLAKIISKRKVIFTNFFPEGLHFENRQEHLANATLWHLRESGGSEKKRLPKTANSNLLLA